MLVTRRITGKVSDENSRSHIARFVKAGGHVCVRSRNVLAYLALARSRAQHVAGPCCQMKWLVCRQDGPAILIRGSYGKTDWGIRGLRALERQIAASLYWGLRKRIHARSMLLPEAGPRQELSRRSRFSRAPSKDCWNFHTPRRRGT